jgi:exodeoxyribonuclease VII large subunit
MDTGTLTVGQLADGIEAALGTWFTGEIWITGEIDSLRRSNRGHVYFQLLERSDDGAVRASIGVTLFDAARRYVNAQLRQAGGGRITDGMQVRLRGRVEYYAPQGRVQILMSGIDPSYTLGLLITERDRVLAALAADGLLTRNQDLPLPPLPLRVGLVTSEASAAMADFVDELRASGIAWQLRFAHVVVQGRGADETIARALRGLERVGVDVIAIVRGGGSRLDLSTFDSELIGRAIATAAVPVLTGIGHEIDTSVADVVAHTSSKTPTACAAHLVASVRSSVERAESRWIELAARVTTRCQEATASLDADARLLARLAGARLDVSRHRLDTCRHRVSRSPTGALDRLDRTLVRDTRLASRARAALSRAESVLAVADTTVRNSDPVVLLRRGWSITRTDDAVVRRITDAAPGDRLFTTLSDGVLESDVTAVRSTSSSKGSTDDD